MVDPFSIIAGTAGLLDVCWKVGSYLRDVEKSAGKINHEIAALSHELTSVISVIESIQHLKERTQDAVPDASLNDDTEIKKLWKEVDTNAKGCTSTLEDLVELLNEIIGKNRSTVAGKVDGIRKQIRRQSKDVALGQYHHRLSNYQANLKTLLAALNVSVKIFDYATQY